MRVRRLPESRRAASLTRTFYLAGTPTLARSLGTSNLAHSSHRSHPVPSCVALPTHRGSLKAHHPCVLRLTLACAAGGGTRVWTRAPSWSGSRPGCLAWRSSRCPASGPSAGRFQPPLLPGGSLGLPLVPPPALLPRTSPLLRWRACCLPAAAGTVRPPSASPSPPLFWAPRSAPGASVPPLLWRRQGGPRAPARGRAGQRGRGCRAWSASPQTATARRSRAG
jgi:hypothetical protein